jgi:predicted ester cyclase
MSLEQNKAIMRRFYEEIANQRRFEVADEIIAPDFRMFQSSSPPYGPEGVKQFMTNLLVLGFPDMNVTIEDMVAEGDTVAVRVTLHATQNVAINWFPGLGTIPPTGKRFDMREYVFWRVVDGKIVERNIVVDSMEMLHQLDVFEGNSKSVTE